MNVIFHFLFLYVGALGVMLMVGKALKGVKMIIVIACSW
jgi:hypothetical protein